MIYSAKKLAIDQKIHWKFWKKNVSTRVVEYLYQKIMYSMELFLYNLKLLVLSCCCSLFCGSVNIQKCMLSLWWWGHFSNIGRIEKKTFSQFIQFVIHAKEMVLMNAPEVLDLLNGNLKLMHCAKHWIKSDSLYDGYFQDISSTIIQGIYLFFISYMKFCAKDMDFLL